jgi:hypothetical protein
MSAILPLLAFKQNGGTKVVGAMLMDRPRSLHLFDSPIQHPKKGDLLVVEQTGEIYIMTNDAMLANFHQSVADQATIDAAQVSGLPIRDYLKKHLV